jgi:hypothetical protein
VFVFQWLDSGTAYGTYDSIWDYNPYLDRIDSSIAGMPSNYREYTISYDAGFDAARVQAEMAMFYARYFDHTFLSHVFVTDGVNGYLFSDLVNPGDGTVDSAVSLAGITSVDQFDWWHIV